MGVEVHILNLQRPLNTDRSCAGCAFVGLNGCGYRFLQMAVIFSPLVSSLLLLVVVCLFVFFSWMNLFLEPWNHFVFILIFFRFSALKNSEHPICNRIIIFCCAVSFSTLYLVIVGSYCTDVFSVWT